MVNGNLTKNMKFTEEKFKDFSGFIEINDFRTFLLLTFTEGDNQDME